MSLSPSLEGHRRRPAAAASGAAARRAARQERSTTYQSIGCACAEHDFHLDAFGRQGEDGEEPPAGGGRSAAAARADLDGLPVRSRSDSSLASIGHQHNPTRAPRGEVSRSRSVPLAARRRVREHGRAPARPCRRAGAGATKARARPRRPRVGRLRLVRRTAAAWRSAGGIGGAARTQPAGLAGVRVLIELQADVCCGACREYGGVTMATHGEDHRQDHRPRGASHRAAQGPAAAASSGSQPCSKTRPAARPSPGAP